MTMMWPENRNTSLLRCKVSIKYMHFNIIKLCDKHCTTVLYCTVLLCVRPGFGAAILLVNSNQLLYGNNDVTSEAQCWCVYQYCYVGMMCLQIIVWFGWLVGLHQHKIMDAKTQTSPWANYNLEVQKCYLQYFFMFRCLDVVIYQKLSQGVLLHFILVLRTFLRDTSG